MAKLIKINRDEAIKVMENNLKILKQCADTETFLVLSYDLEKEQFLGRNRLNMNGGVKLIDKSKTFVLNEEDSREEDAVSILSMYTTTQKDIYHIMPNGKKHDMIIVQKLE